MAASAERGTLCTDEEMADLLQIWKDFIEDYI